MTRAHFPIGGTRAVCLLMASAAALALAACGGGGGDASGDSASGGSDNDADAARVRLQQCLRKQGVDLPTPGQGQGQGQGNFRENPADRQKLEQAMRGPCKKYQEQAFGNVSQEDRREMRDRMVKFSACMRRHGVDMPDPKPGGGPQRIRINADSPRVKKATQACRKLAPRAPGGRGGGGVMMGPAPGAGR